MNTTTQCKAIERYANIIMNARQKGVGESDITSLTSSTPVAFKDSIYQMIETAYKKTRFLRFEENQLESVVLLSTEQKTDCYIR